MNGTKLSLIACFLLLGFAVVLNGMRLYELHSTAKDFKKAVEMLEAKQCK